MADWRHKGRHLAHVGMALLLTTQEKALLLNRTTQKMPHTQGYTTETWYPQFASSTEGLKTSTDVADYVQV